MAVRRWLGDTLLNAGLVTRQQLDEALAAQNTTGRQLGQTLLSLGYVSESTLIQALCSDAGIPFLADSELQPKPDAVALIPPDLARTHVVVPLRLESRHLVIAMADPFDLLSVRALTRAAGRSVRVAGAERDSVLNAIDVAYAGSAGTPRLELSRSNAASGRGATRSGWTTPVSAGADADDTAAGVVEDLVRRGVELGATDVHLEPLEDVVRVRYRIDGLLTDGQSFPKAMQSAIIGRVKTLATLDSSDSRLPQDGRARLALSGRNVDLRVSTFPTLHGEDVVLHVLDRARVQLQLERIGIEAEDLLLVRAALQKPHGLIPVTGPAGSGKTTTLYAALSELNTGDRAIITLEDPIEYEMPQIRQSQVNVKAGLTFASGLRSILRQDPNVILVGEIRDDETMQIALSASLTGHLVLTTMHTTTAAGTIPRLLEMGAEPFAIASAVTMFVSQRLVRVLCSDCKVKIEMPLAVRRRFGLEDATLYGPKGCKACRSTGYKGRVGIFEVLPMSPDIVTAIYERILPDQIQRDSGRPTLLMDGMKKVRSGLTTLDEILRVTT